MNGNGHMSSLSLTQARLKAVSLAFFLSDPVKTAVFMLSFQTTQSSCLFFRATNQIIKPSLKVQNTLL